jgi:hypothetical protein
MTEERQTDWYYLFGEYPRNRTDNTESVAGASNFEDNMNNIRGTYVTISSISGISTSLADVNEYAWELY